MDEIKIDASVALDLLMASGQVVLINRQLSFVPMPNHAPGVREKIETLAQLREVWRLVMRAEINADEAEQIAAAAWARGLVLEAAKLAMHLQQVRAESC